MTDQFSDDFRTVRDAEGTCVCLSAVQGEILRYLVDAGRPCTHGEICEALSECGYETLSLRHAFYAAEGKRVWGELIKPLPTSRGHLILDREFVAKPPQRRRPRRRADTRLKRKTLGERLRMLSRDAIP